eukprot:6033308-Prymnesium_polylepis.1
MAAMRMAQLRTLAMATGAASAASEEASARRAATEMAATLAECGGAAAVHGLDAPQWQQGDTSLYTQGMIEKRTRLRRNGKVKDALHNWWVTALNSMSSEKRRSMVSGVGGAQTEVTEGQYVAMMKKIY